MAIQQRMLLILCSLPLICTVAWTTPPELTGPPTCSQKSVIRRQQKKRVATRFFCRILPHRLLSCIARFAAAGPQVREQVRRMSVRDGSCRQVFAGDEALVLFLSLDISRGGASPATISASWRRAAPFPPRCRAKEGYGLPQLVGAPGGSARRRDMQRTGARVVAGSGYLF